MEYNVIARMEESTVVSEYQPVERRKDVYQSEADLEKEFIELLVSQGYEYLDIHKEEDLIHNLRKQLEMLNSYGFTDREWDYFFKNVINNSNDDLSRKTEMIQEENTFALRRDDGSTKNISLVDKNNIYNNRLQVIHQYTVVNEEGIRNRYDVSILMNGLPMVHVELKRRGEHLQEAFNQIERYKNTSFSTNSRLFEYVQIYVISNGTQSKYYSNTTRENCLNKKVSNSFEFTSYWSDRNNKIINDLIDFTMTFFAKHTLINILTHYCVYTSEKELLVMRPYQIAATEMILNKIKIANEYKKYGTIEAGGYIWHTTGSGKTLTSFKTARLASKLDFIDKVLFIVDRKDLDYQTMKEYDRFEKGAANGNTSTKILKKQLEEDDKKIIITTIQKLSIFIKKNRGHEVYNKQVVFIFDECHRSQFGEMHRDIIHSFKKYYMFGFTGTPIIASNAKGLYTTEQTFGTKLHTYTIVDAINDHNVLPFKVDYVRTMAENEKIEDMSVYDIDRESVLMASERISNITKYILDHFDQKTYREGESYNYRDKRIKGFNSILAVATIDMAKAYYSEFKKQMAERLPDQRLKIATIFSYGEKNDDYGMMEENVEDTSRLDRNSKLFLSDAINDYNKMFNTNFSIEGESFQNYYKDISMRMKEKELDLLIVVNMFLTGFDAKTLNTLWVDKNLRMHGLIQAFSRTNRILNSVKTFGNIVCFRNLDHQVNDAISIYGDKEAGGLVLLRSFEDYYEGYDEDDVHHDGYQELINKLLEEYPLNNMPIVGESRKRAFIKLLGQILKIENVLKSFDDFYGNEIITINEKRDYLSYYNDIRDEFLKIKEKHDKENILDDIVFEMELIKQIDINIDYILMMVKRYHDKHCEDQELYDSILKAVSAAPDLRSKKVLIENFLNRVAGVDDVDEEWIRFVNNEREIELSEIIKEYNLKEKETRSFLDNCFKEGELKTVGIDADRILPKMSRFGGSNRDQKKRDILDRLSLFFDKYYGLTNQSLKV